MHRLSWSALWTTVGVLLLFAMAVAVTLIAPEFIDPSWKLASSVYQVQMHDISDPNVYVTTSNPGGWGLQHVYHLKENFTLLAFRESEVVRFIASQDLEPYITRFGQKTLKLTSRILLLQKPTDHEAVALYRNELQAEWNKEFSDPSPYFEIYELFDPLKKEAFAITETDGVIENWVDHDFEILGDPPSYFTGKGVIYVSNPKEYLISEINYLGTRYWLYDENGEPIQNLTELKSNKLRFLSRRELIKMGEDIYRIEGCWYCHTDQTRTLVQDTVLNGSANYPAPPSSANEYVYQTVTFPGTRRIGPDLSRVGVKRPTRDWHMSHFWFPESKSKGSVMPSFKHFFDDDPTGATKNPYGIPNFKFEAIFQYLMVKGTRITPPNQAWWLGKDPIQTVNILEAKQ